MNLKLSGRGPEPPAPLAPMIRRRPRRLGLGIRLGRVCPAEYAAPAVARPYGELSLALCQPGHGTVALMLTASRRVTKLLTVRLPGPASGKQNTECESEKVPTLKFSGSPRAGGTAAPASLRPASESIISDRHGDVGVYTCVCVLILSDKPSSTVVMCMYLNVSVGILSVCACMCMYYQTTYATNV